MFGSVTRAITFLARTPLVLPPSGPAAMELTTMSASAGPSRRPRAASRAISNMSVRSAYAVPMHTRGYASEQGKKELYSDEAGSPGAGVRLYSLGCLEWQGGRRRAGPQSYIYLPMQKSRAGPGGSVDRDRLEERPLTI